MNRHRLAQLMRKMAELHLEIADELEDKAAPAAPAANDTRPSSRPRRRGPRVVSAEKLAEAGVSDTDRQAAAHVARARGLARNGGGR